MSEFPLASRNSNVRGGWGASAILSVQVRSGARSTVSSRSRRLPSRMRLRRQIDRLFAQQTPPLEDAHFGASHGLVRVEAGHQTSPLAMQVEYSGEVGAGD